MDHTQYTTNGAERKPGTHLTMEDRGAIQAMKKLGHSNRAIARYLHCAPSTISNELKRGTPPRTGSRGRAPGYSAKRGDAVYKENRKNSHKPHRIDKCTSFVQWVVTQVRTEKWSIDACVGYARKNKLFPEEKMVCTKTLYNEVWGGNLSLNILELPEAIKRKKHHKSPVKRKKVYGTSIDERPEIVDSRTEEGHWEGDTVVGKRNGKESVILTLLEKQTQNYIAIRIPLQPEFYNWLFMNRSKVRVVSPNRVIEAYCEYVEAVLLQYELWNMESDEVLSYLTQPTAKTTGKWFKFFEQIMEEVIKKRKSYFKLDKVQFTRDYTG